MNDPSTPAPQDRLTCSSCGYNLAGINLDGSCPECGKPIIEQCLWCEYDLTNTAHDTNCPECGIPVITSIGYGVFAPAPIELLKSIHTGFKTVTILILVYIVTSIAAGIAAAAMTATGSNTANYTMVAVGSTINNGLILAIAFGWWKLSAPLPDLPAGISGEDRRSFLRVMIWIFAAATALTLLLNLIPQNYDPMADPTPINFIAGILSLIFMIVMLIFYIAQVRYIGWFAKLVRNKKMERRAKHLVWSGPLIAILGLPLILIGPLIVLILYWNMIEYTRRDLKKIINQVRYT